MRLVLLSVAQALEVFIRLGDRSRNDVPLGSPSPKVDSFATGAAKGEVLVVPGSSLPADRTKFGTFRHDVRRKF
jgi:hypothetical protein